MRDCASLESVDKNKSVDNNYDLIIRPKRHAFDINFKEIWDYRDLLRMFVKRDIITVYKQTVLGPIWFFIQPILTMMVYVVVFGNIAGLSTDGLPKPLFYLSGIVLWNYFASSLTSNSNIFVSNSGIYGKVYFPRLITPFSLVISGLIKFGIQLCLFIALYLYYIYVGIAIAPNWYLLLLPFLILLMAGLGLGFGILISSLTTKYRDFTFLVGFGVQLMMYATPVIYPTSSLPQTYQKFMFFNPMAHMIEAFKYAFLGIGQVSIEGIIYTTIFTITVLFLGIIVFHRVERNFMDTV